MLEFFRHVFRSTPPTVGGSRPTLRTVVYLRFRAKSRGPGSFTARWLMLPVPGPGFGDGIGPVWARKFA